MGFELHTSDVTSPASLDPGVVQARRRLDAAQRAGIPCAPIRELVGPDDIARAYDIQRLFVDARVAEGHRRVGRKIGITSPSVQAQLGVDQPDFGVLFSDMCVEQNAVVEIDGLLQPRIEAEIAFVLVRDIDEENPSLSTVTAAVGAALPALEIVDSRIADWDISIADTVADNASSAKYVLGESSVDIGAIDPVAVAMVLRRNGEEVSTGTGAACLGSPLAALQWLARVAVEYGDHLRAGEVILSGALGPMVAVRPGDHYEATLTGVGSVSATFSPAESK
ncbi:2-keto-4-pentenoate hydratase [Mycolicibacterium sp. CH28]|uniref:2-keto-4-pentenoate hydratase n=1 Tax=Mycolicibacterium sp. CH28 TaxID=2512237 RepID=UPI001080828D|nr:fumarylacetoacetate hydrolase family protein [Mycolicibacterium sp. CH28]TGD85903.1 2-keto-4-pentenoate hydratase [Mycolicibacterium sp. CH28]